MASNDSDSPLRERVLVSVIKTTPIKPRKTPQQQEEEEAAAPVMMMMPTSPGFSDFMVYPWKWGENAHNVTLSPGSGPPRSPSGTATAREEAGDLSSSSSSSPDHMMMKDGSRRGRPRAETVQELISEGVTSSSHIRCNICNRVFPREKSLQAHKRTHTGERPYLCDYPNCGKAFVQSGQLKTHQRLHTGEKPFACSEKGCSNRFTHANRHCSKHPFSRLKREEAKDCLGKGQSVDNKAVAEWLAKYWRTREQRAHSNVPGGTKGKGPADEDQEQQDPMEFSNSDEENGVEDMAAAAGAAEERGGAAKRCLQEQRERLHGALALIELANNLSA